MNLIKKTTASFTFNFPADFIGDLIIFSPVKCSWEVSDPHLQHLVEAAAKVDVALLTSGEVHEDDVKVELFRSDGRSLEGSNDLTSGSMIVTRLR
jgi:hypothetical protein